METKADDRDAVPPILERLEADESFSTAEVLRLKAVEGLVPRLVAAIEAGSPQAKQAGIRLLSNLGRPVVRAHGDLPDLPAHFVDDKAAVALFVRALADPDRDVRDAAAKALVDLVPDPLVRDHSAAVIANVKAHPTVVGGALVLGKTGAEAARVLLVATPDLRDANPDSTRAALGRLGDRDAEEAAIAAYLAADRPSVKADCAELLGYLATVKAVLTLARDVRTPDTYVWRKDARRSMRIHVIAGLHRAFPTEPVFWQPFFKPGDDSYYEAVEGWLARNLGVTWDRPRPPFLYEEDVAFPPGGDH